jgi:ribosomal protein L44E
LKIQPKATIESHEKAKATSITPPAVLPDAIHVSSLCLLCNPHTTLIVKLMQLSQASELSQPSSTTARGKKRVYGLIKDPIEINRKWNKKPKIDKVVSQA